MMAQPSIHASNHILSFQELGQVDSSSHAEVPKQLKERTTDSLRRTEASLSDLTGSDDGNINDDENVKLKNEWAEFLNGSSAKHDDDGRNNLRDEFLSLVLQHIHDYHDIMASSQSHSDDICFLRSLAQLSLQCLSRLVQLRNETFDKNPTKGIPGLAPIFGEEFVEEIAAPMKFFLQLEPNIVEADLMELSLGASELILNLMHPHRPRNEACVPSIRDDILIPLTSPESSHIRVVESRGRTVAMIAELASKSVVMAVEHTVPNYAGSAGGAVINTSAFAVEDEELAMKRETAALSRMQDVRDVFQNVGKVVLVPFLKERGNFDALEEETTRRVLHAFLAIFDIAPFAMESQLETLLDDHAAPIIDYLKMNCRERRLEQEEKKQQNSNSRNHGETGHEIFETSYEGDEFGNSPDPLHQPPAPPVQLPPIYQTIPKPPAIITSIRQLESTLDSITANLENQDPELWDERLAALVDVECLLAGGVSSTLGVEARHLFIEKIRKMPMTDQFQDLRSQITNQACRVIVALSYEYREYVREDGSLGVAVQHFVDCCTPSILKLCCSGTRLMATQGMNCMLCLAAVGGSTGYPRTISNFCDDIISKKVHKNRKRGSVLALTAAMRVWDGSCFAKHAEKIAKAVKEAVTDRDPGVREDGKKMYWAMISCDRIRGAADNVFAAAGREMKQLTKMRDEVDAEWEEDGVMGKLVRTGVLDEASPSGGTSKTNNSAPPRSMPPRSAVERRPASAPTKVEGDTPNGKFSTPGKGDSQQQGDNSTAVTGRASSRKRPSPSPRRSRLATPTARAASPNSIRSELSASRSVSGIPAPSNQVQSARTPMIVRNGGEPSCGTAASSPVAKRNRLPPTNNGNMQSNVQNVKKPMPLQEINAKPLIRNHENIPMKLETPVKQVITTPKNTRRVDFDSVPASRIVGTPVVNVLARALPLSVEKARNSENALGDILKMLSDTSSRHEQYLGIQALALFAKENPHHPSWDAKFLIVLDCLTGLIKWTRTGGDNEFDNQFEVIKSPSKKLSNRLEAQHLFLQGLRSLLQFVPSHVNGRVEEVVNCLLEVTCDAPFEIVHTSERALQNLVCGTDPDTCFQCLVPFLNDTDVDLSTKSNPPILLSTLRTLRHLIDRISPKTLENNFHSLLLPLFLTTLRHKSVDMRKATIFILVEVYFVLGDGMNMDNFTESQQRLIDVYITKHPKKQAMGDQTLDGVPISLQSKGISA